MIIIKWIPTKQIFNNDFLYQQVGYSSTLDGLFLFVNTQLGLIGFSILNNQVKKSKKNLVRIFNHLYFILHKYVFSKLSVIRNFIIQILWFHIYWYGQHSYFLNRVNENCYYKTIWFSFLIKTFSTFQNWFKFHIKMIIQKKVG